MKKFVDVCRMSQEEVKNYMGKYLANKQYNIESQDGFLYAKGDIPVLLVAHMDTVHKQPVRETMTANGKISSPQGIGGDDRCGIFIIMNIVKELKCSVLLCEDEEIGGVGARKFTKSKFIDKLDVNYIIEFDRANSRDAVFYGCDNAEFTDFVTENTGFKETYGSFSDISVIAPAAKIAAVNLSCGYYKAHTTDEYVVYEEMLNTIEAAKELIKTECGEFEYVPRRQTTLFDSYYNNYSNLANNYYSNSNGISLKKDLDIEVEVIFVRDGEEEVGYGRGRTKAEAWLDFFESYDDVCFQQVIDYSIC